MARYLIENGIPRYNICPADLVKGAILNPVNSFLAKWSMKRHFKQKGLKPVGCLPLFGTELGDFTR